MGTSCTSSLGVRRTKPPPARQPPTSLWPHCPFGDAWINLALGESSEMRSPQRWRRSWPSSPPM
eukprot:1723758-Pyramimonas_sp.AAC.1